MQNTKFYIMFSQIELARNFYNDYSTKMETTTKVPDDQLENAGYPINKKIMVFCLGSFLILFMFVAISGTYINSQQ